MNSKSPTHIEEGDFDIYLTQMVSQSGATIDRFIDLFGASTQQELRDFIVQEEGLEPTVKFFELSY